MRTLLVEDDRSSRHLAVRLLERLGHRADVVGNGREALDALEAAAYDLVLMDLQMPVMGGLEAARAIRRRRVPRGGGRLPIIALTADETALQRRRCLAAGMDDCVAKPLDPRVLSQVIARVVDHAPIRRTRAAAGDRKEQQPDRAERPEVFDRQELIERVAGDEVLCRDLLRLFLKDAPEGLSRLEAAAQSRDAEQIQRQAHALKGAAAYVSARSVQAAAEALEQAGRRNALGRSAALLAALRRELGRLEALYQQAQEVGAF